jgi:hypothetical protein
MEALSASAIKESTLNESMIKLQFQTTATFISIKAKPRDFKTFPKCLTHLNGQNYDKIEDMGQL